MQMPWKNGSFSRRFPNASCFEGRSGKRKLMALRRHCWTMEYALLPWRDE
jgi:hypothetical protein